MSLTEIIVNYIKDADTGIGLDTEPGDQVVIISENKIDEAFASIADNVIFIAKDTSFYGDLLSKYFGLKVIEGSLTQTNLPDKAACFIIAASEITDHNIKKARNELQRISLNGWSDVLIIENDVNNKIVTIELLNNLFAGSGYEYKEFSETNNVTCVYHNPIGYAEDELNTPAISEFIFACEDYCNVIENYKSFSVKDFLYNIQRTLVTYYTKGFGLPNCCGSDGDTNISDKSTQKDVSEFFKMTNELDEFLGKHNVYWSNFSPYPDDGDKEIYSHSLAGDLAEIYEDIKGNVDGFTKGNIYDKQEMLWHFRFDWQGHTGDHWTFAVRAIHWKLQELEYED